MRRPGLAALLLCCACGTRMIRVVEEGRAAEPDTVRVAVLHLKSVNNDRGTVELANANLDLNYGATERLVRMAAASGAKVIVTPEYVTTGISFHLRDRIRLSTPVPPSPTKGALWQEAGEEMAKHLVDYAHLADELDVYLVVNVLERAQEDKLRYYNTLLALDPEGRMVGKYRKINLYIREHLLETAGDELAYFDTPYGRFALMLCLDVLVPWTWGKLKGRHDCDYFVVSTLWEHTPFLGCMAMDLFTTLSNRPILWSNQARMWLAGGAGVYRPFGADVAVGVWAPSAVVVANLPIPERHRAVAATLSP